MDALVASAQIWMPAAGIAVLLLGRAWLNCLAEAREPVAAYFVCLGFASVAPVIASVIAWSLHGGLAQWGPVVLLLEPTSVGQQHLLLASLVVPIIVFLSARFIFASSDAIAYAAAAAGGFAFAHLLPPLAVIPIALGFGGLVGFVDRMLGKTAIAMAGATGFALLFGYLYAGGGPAVPLIALSLVGGICLSLIGAGGKRARIPVYMLLAAVPGLALSAVLHDGGALDLARTMPKPATGNYGALIVLFALSPAIAAPFAALPIWFLGRAKSFLNGTGRPWIAPFALIVVLFIGIVFSAAMAIALAAGGALFNQLHENLGGATLLRVSALVTQIRPSPLGGSNWWLLAFLALPMAPALVQLLRCATSLFLWLLKMAGVSSRLQSAISSDNAGARLVSRSALRVLQIVPSALVLFAIVRVAPFVAEHHGNQLAQASDELLGVCERTARSIEGWRSVMAALCPAGGPLCR
jgi:hypothetical protein